MKVQRMALASCLALAFLSGCALTTDRIEIQYSPMQGVAQVPGAANVTVQVLVADQRPDKSKVSSKKNGFGAETAPILAVSDVADTVRRAMEQELSARGFAPGGGDAALVQIAADLTRFYNDYKVGFVAVDAVADLNMAVTVKSRKGEVLYSRPLVTQHTEPNLQLMLGDNARLALNKVLEVGIRSLFEDKAFVAALMASAGATKSVAMPAPAAASGKPSAAPKASGKAAAKK